MLRGKKSQPARGYAPGDQMIETLAFAKKRDARRKANKVARQARKKNRS